MTPTEFKQRYVAAIPEDVPEQLRDELAEFIKFDSGRLEELALTAADRAILSEVGLPRNAPPFLHFGDSKTELLLPLDGVPNTADIGFSGFGDPICLDLDHGGAVVLISDHDDATRRTTMNRSVAALAQTLCGFAEYRASGDVDALVAEIASIDQTAANDDAWWVNQIKARRPVS